MSVIDLMKKRFSVRSFQDKPVLSEDLNTILEAGRIAPSACNLQPWKFLVIDSDEAREKVCRCYSREWLKETPVVIAVLGDHDVSWKRHDSKDHCDVDAAIAADHMTLAAAELGLGTCWICAFDAAAFRELFDLPRNLEPIALLPVGVPAGQADLNRFDKMRKPLEDIVYHNTL